MKHLNNERGYALVIVMLLVVLFLGFFATFLAGSMNHAAQERTVDTSNQSVAAAEMGVLYYTASFEKELELELKKIQMEVDEELNYLKSNCNSCDFENELKEINSDKKQHYQQAVIKKVEALNLPEGTTDNFKRTISLDGDTAYTIESAVAEVAGDNTKIKVELKLKGLAKQGESEEEQMLDVLFNVVIPDSFLTKSTQIIYDDIYKNPPNISCNDFLSSKHYLQVEPYYECELGDNQSLATLTATINDTYNLNLKDFIVYTDNYAQNVCGNDNGQCTKADFKGVSVMVHGSDDTDVKNTNNLNNIKIYVDGKFTLKNMNSSSSNVIVVKSFELTHNAHGISNTTIVVLGYDDINQLAELKVKTNGNGGNSIELASNSKFCLDADRIIESDITNFGDQITIGDGNLLIYHTSKNKNYFIGKENVKKITDYSEFLSLCNVSVNGSPIANDIDPGFGFEVEY